MRDFIRSRHFALILGMLLALALLSIPSKWVAVPIAAVASLAIGLWFNKMQREGGR